MDQHIGFIKKTLQQGMNGAALELYNYILSSNLRRSITKLDVIPLRNVLDLARTFFAELKESSQNFDIFASVVHQTIRLTQSDDALDICTKFIVEMSKQLPMDSVLLLRFAHQTLRSFSVEDGAHLPIADDFVDLVISRVFSEDKDVRLWSFMCLSHMIENHECTEALVKIWERIKSYKGDMNILDIMAQLIDSFMKVLQIYADVFFWEILLNALTHRVNTNDVKKKVLYILERILEFATTGQIHSSVIIEGYFEWNPQNTEIFKSSWTALIAVLANLEEKQSHLILPSLEMLEKVKVPFYWKEFLLSDLLTQKNSVVLKYVVHYVLKKYNCADLSSKNLQYLMEAMNNTFLYMQGAEFLEIVKNSFQGDVPRIIGIFCLINWKAVPMHALLTTLGSVRSDTDIIPLGSILEVSACIRRIQNKDIRRNLKEPFFELFKKDLEEASLLEFFNVCNTLNTEIEIGSTSISILNAKLSKWTGDLNLPLKHFRILLNTDICNDIKIAGLREFIDRDMCAEDLLTLLEMVVEYSLDHHVLCELVHLLEKNASILKKHDIIMNNEQYFTQLLMKIFKKDCEPWKIQDDFGLLKLRLENKDVGRLEQIFSKIYFTSVIQLTSIDKNCFNWLFLRAKGKVIITAIHKLTEIPALPVEISDVLQQSKEVVQTYGISECGSMFADLLNYSAGRAAFFQVLIHILNFDKNNPTVLKAIFSMSCKNSYLIKSAILHPNRYVDQDFLIDLFVHGLLFGTPLTGDQKIEFDYCLQNNILTSSCNGPETRSIALELLSEFHSYDVNTKTFLGSLNNKLLDISHTMSVRKSRYFGDSMHHRKKLRIVQALTHIQKVLNICDSRLLDIVFKENNQTNVTYIAELLIADSIPEDDLIMLLEQAKGFNPSSLCSLFAITHLALQKYSNVSTTVKCMKLMAPWTMGANFQVRTSAQVAFYHTYNNINLNSVEHEEKLKDSYLYYALEEILKDDGLEEYVKRDFRYSNLKNNDFLDKGNIYVHIPRITNMASDELIRYYKGAEKSTLASVEKKVGRSRNEVQKENNLLEEVQKKVNPVKFEIDQRTENTFSDNLLVEQQRRMIVVASLISKTPNLGGIARTCEVLGIHNLVVDSLKHIKCKEFQSVSMTAEKWLNIKEVKIDKLQNYLLDRKLEGYSIVGAEQTSNSVNFVDFKFPGKSILLLGQEKEGIPANLLTLLDFAVEIPQLGMVRSLNVHVTGALFMWEYFKEHLYKRNGQ